MLTDLDDPTLTAEDRQAALRALLTRRINAGAAPTRLINPLQAADARCAQSINVLKQLLGRAPRCLGVIRSALRTAFGLNPDSVLFTEPGAPVSSLTERALASLKAPFVAANINQFTALSLKDAPQHRLPFTARELLTRVNALGLPGHLDRAVTGYWQHLAHGAWVSRKERWVEVRKALFADQAFIAHQLFELPDAAFELVRQLIEAPSREARMTAGGTWAQVQVSTLLWPGLYQAGVPIPGALHLYRFDAPDALQVVYLPGLTREFHVFSSWARMQTDLPTLLGRSLFPALWQCLPLSRQHQACPTPTAPEAVARALYCGPRLDADALAFSALAMLEGQWQNELACALSINQPWAAPALAPMPVSRNPVQFLGYIERGRKRLTGQVRLGRELDRLLEWDRQRRQDEIQFPSVSVGVALRSREQRVQAYEKGLITLLPAGQPTQDSPAFQAFLDFERQWQTHADRAHQSAQVPQARVFERAYWLERVGTKQRVDDLLAAQREALLLEARMQQQLNVIEPGHVDRLDKLLQSPRVISADACALRVLLAPRQPLHGVFVATTREALDAPGSAHPVLLHVGGFDGGLATFNSLQALTDSLRASLSSPDGSVVWHCVGREVRAQARTALRDGAWHIVYEPIEKPVLHHLFNEQINHLLRLQPRLPALFSETRDPALAQAVLAHELSDRLQVPRNSVRSDALAAVGLWRLAAAQAERQPAWLASATPARRSTYRRLQRRAIASALAFEGKLWQMLPELEDFARTRLVARLTLDGLHPEVDIDKPMFDIPDDVSAHFCGWSSQCVVGDRHIKKVVSAQRTTFSLLQLALHNLDPQAPWTEWRLNRARYLDPVWKARLSPAYLIKTLSALDIGGQYDSLIHQAFYPPRDGILQSLSARALQHQAQAQLFLSVQDGLGSAAQRLFSTAMAAREVGDLHKDGQHVRVCFVRLRGHTLEQDRHLAGLLVLHDAAAGRCVVYWPAALDHPVIAEYPSLELAERALNLQLASSVHIARLAPAVAPGWEAQALASYPGAVSKAGAEMRSVLRFSRFLYLGVYVFDIGEGISRFIRSFKVKHRQPATALETIQAQMHEQMAAAPDDWLAITPTHHTNPLVLLGHARLLEIQHRSQGRSQSAKVLQAYREQRLGEQQAATIRGLLSFVPLIGVGISLYEMLLAARRYHHSGDARDAVDVAFMTVLAFFDVMTAWVPAGRGAHTRGGALARGAVQSGLKQMHRRLAWVNDSATRAPVPLLPPVKVVERFRLDLPATGAVALQGPSSKGLYAQHGEQFVVHEGARYPVYRRKHEQVLRLKNRQADGQDELILHIEEPREWLLGADAPQPGPSTGMWRPWQAVSSGTDWAPPSRAALEQAVRASPLAASGWQGWGFRLSAALTEVLPARRIYYVPAQLNADAFEAVRLGLDYYRLLPEGSAPSGNLVFISENRSLSPRAATEIHHWLGVGMAEQPIPATLGADGLWTSHRVLFHEPLEHSLRVAFPSLTNGSRRWLGERLIELADLGRRVTSTHLLVIRATLDKWLDPLARGRTDDVLRMLRPTEGRGRVSINIGIEGQSPGLHRVDFRPPFVLDSGLRISRRQNQSHRAQTIQRAVREVLEQQGFSVETVYKKPGTQYSADFYCTHPQSHNVYYVLTRWARSTGINLNATPAVQLTDAWFSQRIASRAYEKVFDKVRQAMAEQRLVKIIAGIQWTDRTLPSVYFVKFGGVTAGPTTLHLPHQRVPR